jgi:putative hydrolase of the HAD superfamily
MRPASDPAPSYGAIVFDLFGTLIEFDASRLPTLVMHGTRVASTVPVFAERLRSYVPGVGLDTFVAAMRAVTEELRVRNGPALVETTSRERFRQALIAIDCAEADLDEAAVVLSRAHHAAIGDATVFPPGHRAVLDAAAARGPVAVVSNFDDTASAFAILARHGILPVLGTVVVSDALGLRKPHPALLVSALATLGVGADETLFVGDSFPADVGVAHAVGADAAWIDAGAVGVPVGATPPRYVLRRLNDLLAVVGAA